MPKNLALNVVAKANRLAAGSAGVVRTNTIAVSPGVARANSVAVSSSVARANSIATTAGVAKANSIATTSAGVAKANSIAAADNVPEIIAKAVDSSKQGKWNFCLRFRQFILKTKFQLFFCHINNY